MSDEQTTQPADTALSGKALMDKIASMEAEITRLKTNPENRPMTIQCNVCGDVLEEGKRCERHPNDKVNHVRDDGVLAKQI